MLALNITDSPLSTLQTNNRLEVNDTSRTERPRGIYGEKIVDVLMLVNNFALNFPQA